MTLNLPINTLFDIQISTEAQVLLTTPAVNLLTPSISYPSDFSYDPSYLQKVLGGIIYGSLPGAIGPVELEALKEFDFTITNFWDFKSVFGLSDVVQASN